MQGILVLKEMPTGCGNCPLVLAGLDECMTGMTFNVEMRPVWCPLVEAPKRIDNPNSLQIAWNKCLDKIGI